MATFEQKSVDGVLVLQPQKNLVGGDETNELLTAIDQLAAAGPARVVIDLGEIKWLSSLGVGMMRKASMTCTRSGGWLRLARISAPIENTLLVTGLSIYFDTFDTVEMAVAAPANAAQRGAPGQPQDRSKRPDVS